MATSAQPINRNPKTARELRDQINKIYSQLEQLAHFLELQNDEAIVRLFSGCTMKTESLNVFSMEVKRLQDLLQKGILYKGEVEINLTKHLDRVDKVIGVEYDSKFIGKEYR